MNKPPAFVPLELEFSPGDNEAWLALPCGATVFAMALLAWHTDDPGLSIDDVYHQLFSGREVSSPDRSGWRYRLVPHSQGVYRVSDAQVDDSVYPSAASILSRLAADESIRAGARLEFARLQRRGLV